MLKNLFVRSSSRFWIRHVMRMPGLRARQPLRASHSRKEENTVHETLNEVLKRMNALEATLDAHLRSPRLLDFSRFQKSE